MITGSLVASQTNSYRRIVLILAKVSDQQQLSCPKLKCKKR